MKLPVLFAILTALFWGMYGPAIGESRQGLSSPFKPYVAIGIAYLIWGIGGGLLGMMYKGDNFNFSGIGGIWGLIGGSLGAFGALTLTLAMYNGGKPFLVMPIVFGGAVTVNAITTYVANTVKRTSHEPVHPMLWVGMAGILACTIIVAYYTPHAPPPGAKKPAPHAAQAPGAAVPPTQHS